MLAIEKGNMAAVYAEFARIEELENLARSREAKHGPIGAELAIGHDANWHCVVPFAGCSGQASRHLTRRRFGVFQPMLKKKHETRYGIVERKEEVFPGYLLIFVWGIGKQVHRVLQCPGVYSILMEGGRPGVIPDKFIDELQSRETVIEGEGKSKKRLRGKWKRWANLDSGFVPSIGGKSYLGKIEDLEPNARIDLLHRALRLPSQEYPARASLQDVS